MTCHNWALTAETKSHIEAADEVASRCAMVFVGVVSRDGLGLGRNIT